MIRVEVAYAEPERQVILTVEGEDGMTAEQAVRRSGILQQFPHIDLGGCRLGVFGKLGKHDTPLRDGDRVEIYRALKADPKEVRRRRAEQGLRTKKGGGPIADD